MTREELRLAALNLASGLPNIWTSENLIKEAAQIEAYLMYSGKPKQITHEDLYGPL